MHPIFRWRTVYSYLLILLAVLAAAGLYLIVQTGRTQRASFEQARLAAAQAAAQRPRLVESWQAGPEALAAELADLAALLDAHVSAVSADGAVLADSAPGSVPQDELFQTPEVRAALAGNPGQSTRPLAGSETFGYHVAVPVRQGETLLGALHVAYSQQPLDASLAALQRIYLFALGGAALSLCALVLFVAERYTRALQRMAQAVARITAGDLDARIVALTRGETGELARAFNRMADKLQRQWKKRAREKDRLNTVMHVMTDGIVILNRAGEVKLINPAAARLLNTTAEKAMDRSFMQAARDHRIAEVWTRCQQSGQEEVAAVELSATQYVRVVVTPYLKRAGRGYLVLLQDLSQMRRLQTIRQDFISNISHELRTPLASLRALAETLRDSALDDPPAAHRFLDRMEVEVDALTQMVEELLELARIESGQAPLRLNSTPLPAAITPAVERLRAQAERSHVSITLELPPELPPVLADAARIHQVVANLVHNAIKFTPAGGAVTVRAQADGDQVTVIVEDTGIGIAPKDLPRIFERFYKADRARTGASGSGGTGLGLAIAKHLVQAHGGLIWAESKEGEGSCFLFTLPRAEPPAGGAPSDSPQ